MTKTTYHSRRARLERVLRVSRRLLVFWGAVGVIAFCRAQTSEAKTQAWAAFSSEMLADFTIIPAEPAAGGARGEVYLPRSSEGAAPEKPPVLMLVHGGGWSGGSRAALAPHARYFAALGWVSVNVSYRLTSAPGVTLTQAQEDVRSAFAWIQAEAARRGWDADRLSVLGESAGGQLACALGILPPDRERWRARSLVLVNPVLDLTSLHWTRNLPGLKTTVPLNPAAPANDPAWKHSPFFHLTADTPPILLLHGRKDVTVPIAQAEAFTARAKEIGAKVEFVAFDDTAHAFLLVSRGRPEQIRESLERIAAFLNTR